MKFIPILFLISLLILPTVLSDVVDITIEYETTTTPTGGTTTPSGDEDGSSSSDGGGGVVTTTVETITEEWILTYSMPEYFEIYQDETSVFNIKVNNDGQLALNNIFITVSGISEDSYSISPSSVSKLEPDDSYSFSISVNPEKLSVGPHILTIEISSDEESETTSLTLDVKAYTRDIAEEIEEQEKFGEDIEPRTEAFKYLLIGIVLVTAVALINVFLGFIKSSKESMEIPWS